MFIGKETIKNALNYIKELEEENEKYKELANKNLENEIIFREKHLPDEIYELQTKLEDSTPNSVIREELEEAEKKYKKWRTHIGRLRYEGKIELCKELLRKDEQEILEKVEK